MRREWARVWRGVQGLKLTLALASVPGVVLANPIVVSTTGVVISGTDLAGNDLTSDQYSLTLTFAGLGYSTFTSGNVATTQGGLLGTAVARVGGAVYTTTVTGDFGSLVDLSQFAIAAQLVGDDFAGQITDGMISVDSVSGGFGPPSLTQRISYTPKAGDFGMDSYAFTNAAGLTVSFSGDPDYLSVPEATSGALLLTSLGTLALASRSRSRRP